jgi:hypothetical protein
MDNVGNVSESAVSDGITIDTDAPVISSVAEGSSSAGSSSGDNYSLSFDGVDDYVSIGDNSDFDIQDAITISVKVKPNSIQTSSIIDRWAGYNTGYRLNLRGGPVDPSHDGAIWAQFGVGDNEYATSPNDTYSPNEWIEITGVWKNNNYIKLFKDGLLIDETSTNKSFDTDQPLEFARLNYNGDDSEYLDGLMDDVAIWNFELSEDQINDYVNSNVNVVEGLVAGWKFNSGDGDIMDDHSGNANHGTINGASWNLIPVPGGNNSLSFDGVDDYVNVSNASSLNINGNVSISAWVNFSNFDNDLACVMSKAGGGNGGYHIEKTAGANSLSLWIENGDDGPIGVTTNVLDANTWYHIVGTNDGTTSKIYVDGSLINSVSMGNPGGGEGDFKIGYNSDNVGSNRYWNGNIDEVAIWNTTLTQEEIQANMSSELVGTEEGLVGYWNFNEGDGPELTDLTGNENHGTISGASWSGDAAPVEPPVYGCTDEYAGNYNPDAVADDGTCSDYPQDGNHSLSFNGEDDYVLIASDNSLISQNNEITFTSWVKVPSNQLNNYSTLIGGRSGYGYTLWAGGNADNGAIRLNICFDNPSEVVGNTDKMPIIIS